MLKRLLDNAFKFTERGGVAVSAAASGEGVEIAVADTGIGIDARDVPCIFDAFRQVDGSTRRCHGGVGLGLYVVRRLVEVLVGRVTVDSEPGRGSTFCVWLPLTPRTRPGGG